MHELATGHPPLDLHERLPATRVLAADLGISRVTVEAAYAQLEKEGYLQRRVGRGSFVAIAMHHARPLQPKPASLPHSPIRQPSVARPPSAHTPSLVSQRGRRMVDTGGCVNSLQPQAFAGGSPDLRAFPMLVWRQLINRRLREEPEQLMRYGEPQGRADLRSAIAHYLAHSRGVHCTQEQLLVLSSSQQALQLLATMLLDEGEPVWMEEPGYFGARTAFAGAGAQIINLEVDEHGAILDRSLPLPRLIYLTPSHQYPTGYTLSLERRLAFIEFAKQNDIWLVEDDYDSEFQYDVRPSPSLQGLDRGHRVIYIGTFSKALFPSLRLAYVVLPSTLMPSMVIGKSIFDGHAAQLMQAVTADFITQGHFAAHLRLMRQLYRSRRDILLEAIAQHLPWAEPLNSAAGLQLSVRLPAGSEAQLSRQATALGVITPSLSALYQDGRQIDGWRLGFAALQPAEISASIKLLAQIEVG